MSGINPPRPATAGPTAARGPSGWIPVRSLGPHHRGRILAHLLALEPHDRYLRFGYAASDEHVARYVDDLRFDRDEVFGIFNRRLELIAMAHLALPDALGQAPPLPAAVTATAEFAVSVLAKARGRGFGMRLFELSMMHARNRGIRWLVIHALSQNAAMLALARKAGARVERHGNEAEARLALPPDDWSSRLAQALERHAADLDYRLKLEAHRFNELLEAVAHIPQDAERE